MSVHERKTTKFITKCLFNYISFPPDLTCYCMYNSLTSLMTNKPIKLIIHHSTEAVQFEAYFLFKRATDSLN